MRREELKPNGVLLGPISPPTFTAKGLDQHGPDIDPGALA